jgi:hypothetical protein
MLIVSVTTQAQTIDTTSEWRVNYQEVWEPYDFYNNLYRDFIEGDTIINSVEYFKVYQSGYSYYGYIPNGDIYTYEHVLHGFLREENNKWFTLFENQDTLLFDFNLNVNDTVISAYTYSFADPIMVTAIDSVLIDGEYKKRMQLNGMGAEFIIEGIGATSGLFENMFFFEWYSELVCYAKNGVSVWGTPTEECDLAVNINENQGDENPCVISPNPGKDFIMLSIPPGLGKVEIILINLLGGIVYQDSFIGPSSNKINLNDFPAGFYLVIIKSKGLRQTTKLIIE